MGLDDGNKKPPLSAASELVAFEGPFPWTAVLFRRAHTGQRACPWLGLITPWPLQWLRAGLCALWDRERKRMLQGPGVETRHQGERPAV